MYEYKPYYTERKFGEKGYFRYSINIGDGLWANTDCINTKLSYTLHLSSKMHWRYRWIIYLSTVDIKVQNLTQTATFFYKNINACCIITIFFHIASFELLNENIETTKTDVLEARTVSSNL